MPDVGYADALRSLDSARRALAEANALDLAGSDGAPNPDAIQVLASADSAYRLAMKQVCEVAHQRGLPSPSFCDDESN